MNKRQHRKHVKGRRHWWRLCRAPGHKALRAYWRLHGGPRPLVHVFNTVPIHRVTEFQELWQEMVSIGAVPDGPPPEL